MEDGVAGDPLSPMFQTSWNCEKRGSKCCFLGYWVNQEVTSEKKTSLVPGQTRCSFPLLSQAFAGFQASFP